MIVARLGQICIPSLPAQPGVSSLGMGCSDAGDEVGDKASEDGGPGSHGACCQPGYRRLVHGIQCTGRGLTHPSGGLASARRVERHETSGTERTGVSSCARRAVRTCARLGGLAAVGC